MRIVDKDAMQAARERCRCEYCGRRTPHGTDPHHLLSRGHGAGTRLDCRFSLVSLCRQCHTDYHAGLIPRCDLAAIICQREGLTLGEQELVTVLLVLQDLPSRPIAGDLERRLATLSAGECALVQRILGEVGHGS